jgi:hypothetical protein
MQKIQNSQRDRKLTKLEILEDKELMEMPDYSTKALKILKTETQAMLCEVN